MWPLTDVLDPPVTYAKCLLKIIRAIQSINLFDVYIRDSMTVVNKQDNAKGHRTNKSMSMSMSMSLLS